MITIKRLKVIIIVLLSFMFMTVVNAEEYTYSFIPGRTVFVLSSMTTNVLSWNIAYQSSTTTSTMVTITDKDNNIIATGATGTLENTESNPIQFPITFRYTPGSDTDYRLDIRVIDGSSSNGGSTGSDTGAETNSLLSDIKNYLNDVLERIYQKLVSIDNKINDIINNFSLSNQKLDRIISLLTDSQALDNSVNHLKNSVDDVVNYQPLNPTNTGQAINNITLAEGELPKINVKFAEGVSFNVFDLSAFQNEIVTIRKVLVATLYLSLFLYFVQYVMPKFKV